MAAYSDSVSTNPTLLWPCDIGAAAAGLTARTQSTLGRLLPGESYFRELADKIAPLVTQICLEQIHFGLPNSFRQLRAHPFAGPSS